MRKLLLILLILSFWVVGSVEAYNILGGQQSYVGSNCSCTAFYGIPNFENGLSIFGPLSFYPNGYVATNMPFTTTSALGISYGTSAVVSNGGFITINGGVYETGMLLTGQTMTIPSFTIGDVNQLENYNLGFFGSPFTSLGTFAAFNVLDPATAYPTLGNWYAYPLPGWNFTFTIPGTNISLPTMSGYYGMYDPLNSMGFNGFGGIRNFYIVPEYNHNSSANPQSFDFRYGGVLEIAGLSPSYYELYIDPFNVLMQSGSNMTITASNDITLSSNNMSINSSNELQINSNDTSINSGSLAISSQWSTTIQSQNDTIISSTNNIGLNSGEINIASNGLLITSNGDTSIISNNDTSIISSNNTLMNSNNLSISSNNIDLLSPSINLNLIGLLISTSQPKIINLNYSEGSAPVNLVGVQENGIQSNGNTVYAFGTGVAVYNSNLSQLLYSYNGNGSASSPVTLTILPNDNIAFIDYFNKTVTLLSPTLTVIWTATTTAQPFACVYSPQTGNLWVGETSASHASIVEEINTLTGTIITTIAINAPNGDSAPGVTVDKDGNIWVPLLDASSEILHGTTIAKIDTSNLEISYFTMNGYGDGPVQAVNVGDYIYVGMYSDGSINQFDLDGNFIRNYQMADYVTGTVLPYGGFNGNTNGNIATDMYGNIYENAVINNVHYTLVFNSNMNYLTAFTQPSTVQGGFYNTSQPTVAIHNNIYYLPENNLGVSSLLFASFPSVFFDGTNIRSYNTFGIYGSGQTSSTIGMYDNNTGSYNMSHTVNYDTQQLMNGCATVSLSLPFLANQYSCTFNYISHNYSVGIPTFTFTTNSFTVCTTTNNGSINTLDNNFFTGICTGY